MPGLSLCARAAALGLFLAGPASAQQPAPADPPMPLPGEAAIGRVAGVVASEAPPAPPAPPPCGGPLLERQKLTGDWFGARGALRDHGFTWDISSTNVYQGVTSGGLDNGFRFGGRADYLLNIDGQKAGLWQGLFIDLHGETNYGDSANGQTGALMPINTAALFPTPNTPVTALTGVKLTQALSENFVLFAGKINTLDGFNQPFTGGGRGTNGFMNTALLAPTVALRTVPYSTYGAGFAVLKDMEPVLSVMVLDTNNTPTTNGFDTFFDNGATVFGIVNLPVAVLDRPGHQGVGFTYSSRRYAALDSLPYFVAERLRGDVGPLPTETGSWSLFYLFDQAVWVDVADPKRSWGLFGNLGLADGSTSPIRWTGNAGVGGSSPLACRRGDTFGVGYFYIGASDALKNFAPRALPLRDEHGVELFYNAAVTPWFHVTPDLQVITPVRERVETSVNFALRAKFDF